MPTCKSGPGLAGFCRLVEKTFLHGKQTFFFHGKTRVAKIVFATNCEAIYQNQAYVGIK